MDEGLAKLDAILKKFEQLPTKVENIVTQALKKDERLMADLNRLQLNSGIRSTGLPIGQYSPRTKMIKQSKGQISSHVTLRDKGDFQDLLEAKKFGKSYVFRSRDIKAPMLEKIWGSDIFGLTAENLRIVEMTAEPDIRQMLKNFLKYV
jgi:hypothetical protein